MRIIVFNEVKNRFNDELHMLLGIETTKQHV